VAIAVELEKPERVLEEVGMLEVLLRQGLVNVLFAETDEETDAVLELGSDLDLELDEVGAVIKPEVVDPEFNPEPEPEPDVIVAVPMTN
jgi:hypothetical protein